mmetsp:Transcript_39512/g.60313  ORF Transcript_39512/g.60313 Transcript_39512/m.60313 type:complete len:97 (-) Transcript_39512:7-297(-)
MLPTSPAFNRLPNRLNLEAAVWVDLCVDSRLRIVYFGENELVPHEDLEAALVLTTDHVGEQLFLAQEEGHSLLVLHISILRIGRYNAFGLGLRHSL